MSTRPEDLHNQFLQDLQEDSEDYDFDMAPKSLIRAAVSGATGLLFGIALEKGRVFEPQVIRDQMLFERFVMLKMFLSASLIGMVCFSFLSMLPQTAGKMGYALKTYAEGLKFKNMTGLLLGGALLGVGMTLSGACPGTVLVQLGAQVPNAWATISGSLCGALVYSMMDSTIASLFKRKTKYQSSFLDDYLRVPYWSLAIPLASTMALVVFGLEYLAPWYTEVPESLLTPGIMKAGAWPPFFTGMLIGTLQIPIVLAVQDTLGSATSYVTVVAQFLPFVKGGVGDDYLRKYRFGMKNWWQVLYVGGAVLGSWLSAKASGTVGTVTGVPFSQAFFGGFLLLYGSRLAGGCTSGHGLSGMGLLALSSFAVVPAMFGGGIATAAFMKHFLQVPF